MSTFRKFFPYFEQSNELYLDSAATSQRLKSSLESMQQYYFEFNANVHRSTYASARDATEHYEAARTQLATFIGCNNADELVFTSGATEAINTIAMGLPKNALSGNKIVILESEHHANILPWQRYAGQNNMTIIRIPLGKFGIFGQNQLENALNLINDDVAIIAMAHVSNVLGNIYPVSKICQKASLHNAITVVDGTQAPAHIAIDVTALNCDFYVFSGHKMYAGTGIGVLYGKYKYLEQLAPLKLGGEMIKKVSWHSYELQAPPLKFEAGTQNIAGAISMAKAGEFISKNITKMQMHENGLYDYLVTNLMQLSKQYDICILGNNKESIALLAFYVKDISSNDIATYLANHNIAVRAGQHCAMPLMQSLGIDGCVRVSIACYTTQNEIDTLLLTLQECLSFLKNDENHDSQAYYATVNKKSELSEKTEQNTIEAKLQAATDWNNKHRLLLLNSKNLSTLAPEHRIKSNFIDGCETNVWLGITTLPNKTSNLSLLAYADSKIVRGILALILDKLNNMPEAHKSQFDINKYLHTLGLSHYFSEGRRDGIQQIIKRIRLIYNA